MLSSAGSGGLRIEEEAMVQVEAERAEPVMRHIEQLQLKELEDYARRLRQEGALSAVDSNDPGVRVRRPDDVPNDL